MFCYQCQETLKNQGCTARGICGKDDQVANLQNLLLDIVKGISFWTTTIRSKNIKTDLKSVNEFVAKALFSTITNANFDADWFLEKIKMAIEVRKNVEKIATATDNIKIVPAAAKWESNISKENIAELVAKGKQVGILSTENEDIRSLTELLMYGIKGIAAYGEHAFNLGYHDESVWAYIQKALATMLDPNRSAETLLQLIDECGANGVKIMALLDKANTETYGHPEPTAVNLGVKPGPGILISGHDLLDLYELLQQTAGKGINIYTHGEMLPANAYPKLKAFPHLVGNYGGSWWHQTKEFETFNGPILLTTNCLVPPLKSYIDRVYVTGNVGFPGVKYIPEREPGKQKDFSGIIAHALKTQTPKELEQGSITIGFAHNTVLGVADKVVNAIKNGLIKRFVVMGGCDGRFKEREYFTKVAEQLPKDTIILTAGCAKYRYNKLPLGDIGGIPRVLDAGQCNDSYSLAAIALKLAEVFGKETINDLPISFDLGWYEQKAVLVLLVLLHLGVKKIRLGPTIPAFLSPNIAAALIQKYDLKLISTPEEDISAMLAGN
jgi:hydroxylamine reductase